MRWWVRRRVPLPRRRSEEQLHTDLGAGLLLLGGWHLVLGSHCKLGRPLPWEGNSADEKLPPRTQPGLCSQPHTRTPRPYPTARPALPAPSC